MFRYHAEALSLAGLELRPSAAAEERVVAIEAALRRRLPASVREFLASDGWPGLLEQFSNSDQPIPVDDLRASRWRDYDPVQHGVLPFMIETQGVCTWAIALDAGDDPEVLVEVDSGNPPAWQHAAPSFSLWVRCQVLDRQLLERALFAAQAAPLAEAALAQLERRFAAGPRTFGWPTRTIHRFHGDLGSLLLWAGDNQCDWWIAPAALDTATELLDLLPVACDGALYELRPEGKDVLDAWLSADR
ncbi:MAG TPA: SMI1/KNR4 family protein [Kofleriaceae bacterium]|nr:SMI1/KNR4 family protein [Kofleriaceae bacterium]